MRFWHTLCTKLKGWRTVVASGLTATIGLANVCGAVDLRPLISLLLHGDEAQIGAVMTVLALMFAVLRAITTTPIGSRDP